MANKDSRAIIRLVDEDSGTELYGGQVLIADERGEDYTHAYDAVHQTFNSFWSVENPDDPESPEIYLVPFGRYRVVVVEPGHFPDQEDTHLKPESGAVFDFQPGTEQVIEIACKAKVARAQDNEPAKKSKKDREAERRRSAVFATYIGGSILLAFAAVLMVFPMIYFTLEACVSTFLPERGLAFAFKLGGWYFGYGFLYNGWPALGDYSDVYGLEWSLVLCAAALTIGGYLYAYWQGGKWAEMQLLPKSELLDSLPKPLDTNIHGNARLVRAPSIIRRDERLATYDPNGEAKAERGWREGLRRAIFKAEDVLPGKLSKKAHAALDDEITEALAPNDSKLSETTFFVGYIDGPVQQAALERAMLPVRLAAWHIERLYRTKVRHQTDIFGNVDIRQKPSLTDSMRYVYIPEFCHIMLVGTTRSGKTRKSLLSTIVLNLLAGVSMLILDSKGELYALTGDAARKQCGEDNVAVINLRDGEASDRTNPLQPVIDAAHASIGGYYRRDANGRVLGDYARMEMRASDFVKQLIPEEFDTGSAKFFNQGARAAIKSGVCYIASEQSLCPDDERSVAKVALLIDEYMRPIANGGKSRTSWVPYKKLLDRLPHDHPAVTSFASCVGTKDEYLSAFCTTALNFLQDWRDRAIEKMTTATDIKFEELGRKQSVIYLIVPHEKQTYDRIASLFIQQAYQALIEEAITNGVAGRLKQPVTFLCEEFGQIPPLPNIDNKLNVSLSSGIQWVLVYQSLGQIEKVYDEKYRRVVWDSCQYHVLLATGDTELTAKKFSEEMGDYDCLERTTQKQRGFFSFVPSTATESKVTRGRKICTESELNSWSAEKEGGLVSRHSGGGPWAIPLPDVSKTPVGEILRINDKDYIAEQYKKAFSVTPSPFDETISWEPCLEETPTEGLTEDTFKAIRDAFFKKLKGGKDGEAHAAVPLRADEPEEPAEKIPLRIKKGRNLEREKERPESSLRDYLMALGPDYAPTFESVGEDTDELKVRQAVIHGVRMGVGAARRDVEARAAAAANTLSAFDKYFELEVAGKHAKTEVKEAGEKKKRDDPAEKAPKSEPAQSVGYF